jgi:hypothetical protein
MVGAFPLAPAEAVVELTLMRLEAKQTFPSDSRRREEG